MMEEEPDYKSFWKDYGKKFFFVAFVSIWPLLIVGIVITLILTLGGVPHGQFVQDIQNLGAQKLGKYPFYPNPPTGEIRENAEETVCKVSTKQFRHTSQDTKKMVLFKYQNPRPPLEIDHWIPLSLGGADTQANLWPQPEKATIRNKNYGFREKDRLEQYLFHKVCKNSMPLKEAQEKIQDDWIRAYKDIFESGKLGIEGIDFYECIDGCP